MIGPDSWERVLPPSWRGGSLAALKRRHRARRALAAALVAVAALAVFGHFTSAGAQVRVLVAARDLAAGQRLTAADLRTVMWPAAVGAPRLNATDTVGEVLNGPLQAGDPITASRLRAARGWPSGADRVVLSVAVDPVLARVVDAGDRMDVYGNGRLLTANAIVTDAAASAGSQEWTGDADEPRVLLAVPASDAPAVAGALQDQSGTVSLALHPSV